MGGPMLLAEPSMINEGIRMIDVRHERATAFSAQAYSRQSPALHGGLGPGGDQPVDRPRNALIDCCPVAR